LEKEEERSKLRGELTFYILDAILENGGLKKSASKGYERASQAKVYFKKKKNEVNYAVN
jgi:hypothetical protein